MSSSRNHFSIERRPRMLKDFLIDHDSNSCSSSGFKPFPRRLEDQYHSSRSKAAASTTVSALQAIINAVKSFQFNAVKSPSILPRSFSHKLSKKNSKKEIINDIKTTVRVRDIIRWKSFCDLVDEKSHPSDLPSSPDHHHCTTTTTATGSTYSTTCSSNKSSWCESDFTSDYLSSWCGNFENDTEVGEKYLPCVGSKSMKATIESAVNTAVGPKELQCDHEEEQRSPVSVLGFELDEDEDEDEDVLMPKLRRFESLTKLDNPTNLETWMSMEENDVVYGDDDDEEEEEEEINEVEGKAWIKGEHNAATLIDGVASCVRDMDMKESWNKFEGEQEEVSLQIENTLLNLLLDELLLDL